MRNALPVLTFHAVDELSSVISYPPAAFARGMASLHRSGYRTLPLSEAVAALRERRPFPDRAIVLTFDDGYASVYTAAFPTLQRYGMSATVFLTLGPERNDDPAARLPTFGGRSMLSWTEIREMQRAGIEFGAHTLTHPDLTRIPDDEIAREMRVSRQRIEDALGAPATTFAYPFGRFDARSHRIAQEYFTCACADTLGLLSTRSDPYAMERVDSYYLQPDRLFGLMSSWVFPWYVRARNAPRQLRRSLRARVGS